MITQPIPDSAPMAAAPVCFSCGETADRPGAKFCENCGVPLAGDASVTKGCRCSEPDPDEDGYCRACGMKAAASPQIGELRKPDYEEFVDARLAIACDRGRRHSVNQDFGAVARRTDGTSFVVVCDGVSSSDNAEAAAHAAVAAAKACFLTGSGSLVGLPQDEQARRCVEAAATAVLEVETVALDPDDGPAATIVLAVVKDRSAGLAWAGDSRAYLVMAGVPEEQITRDDSWCMEVVDAGRMTYEAALLDVNAHAITQSLGMKPSDLDVHAKLVPIPPPMSLIVCSDGLWNYLDAKGRLGAAYEEASRDADNREACRRLVALANAAGGHDNITVAILTPT